MSLSVMPIGTNAVPKINKQQKKVNYNPTFLGGVKKVCPTKMDLDFTKYNPIAKLLGGVTIFIHNLKIADKLKSAYTKEDFKDLYDYTKSQGTFDYVENQKTGLVKTSFIETEENELMSDLVWITDSCHNMDLVKANEPKRCTEIFNKVTEFYAAQQGAFDHAIANPHEYNWNGLYWAGEQRVGIGHCYIPETKEAHPWYPKTRLESVGNYLQTAADLISSGMSGKEFGYKTSEEVPDSVVNAISNTTAYLKALHYPTARSCGAWEEQTFVYSLTSDTSIINQGVREIMKLMYEDTDNQELLALRDRIYNSKHGWVFKDRDALTALLKAGERRIAENPNVETLPKIDYQVSPNDKKSLARQYDAAMSFMPQTETLIEGNAYDDAVAKMAMLEELSYAIVRDNGAIRYAGDEYLRLDSHTVKDKFSQDFEAEWFLVSEISKGYGAIVKQLVQYLKEHPEDDERGTALLNKALELETQYINRSYARITPENTTKANGYPCPPFKVPEAYEAVTTKDGVIKYVPGAHPLTWAESSLKSASDMFLENLKRVETLWK